MPLFMTYYYFIVSSPAMSFSGC